jgi:hypothetical protein
MKLHNRSNHNSMFAFIKKKDPVLKVEENPSDVSDMETILTTNREENVSHADMRQMRNFFEASMPKSKNNKENYTQNVV